MNGLLQQAKRAARGFRTGRNFIAIAYLRLSKLKHLPAQSARPSAGQMRLSRSTRNGIEPACSPMLRT